MTEQEKIAYLDEHVSYEVVMLNYTFMRVLTCGPRHRKSNSTSMLSWSRFGVHARNLVDFLSKKSRKDDRNASDYVPNFEVSLDRASTGAGLFRFEKQILRVHDLQTRDCQDRFNADDAREIYYWVVPAILNFQEKLNHRVPREPECPRAS